MCWFCFSPRPPGHGKSKIKKSRRAKLPDGMTKKPLRRCAEEADARINELYKYAAFRLCSPATWMNFTERRRRFPSIPNEVQIKFKSRKHFSLIRASEISGKSRTAGQEISVAEGVLRLADVRRVREDEEVRAHGEEGTSHHRPLANPLRRLPRESLYAPRIFAHLYPFRFIHHPFRRWSRPSSLHHAATSYILDPIY